MSLADAPSSMVSIVSSVRDSGRTVAGVPPVLVGASVSSAPELRGRAYLVHHVFYEDGSASGGGVAPASRASVAALREVLEEAAEASECAICLDGDGEPRREARGRKEMPCGHRFHGECVERWLGIHGSCPLCRREMPAEEVVVAMVHGERVVMRGRRVVLSVLVIGRPADDDAGEETPLPPRSVLIDDLD
ncbi:E3 ubiquitin-protein ligase AIP2-like [Oryza brachyantha]|uniref:E3 ubiquitin-protein ligase AIP2-like n=1 Tax=Oryza brachyantha TaxID=4533 RepID=UPI001ADA765F|nr:E3 ubiquitin-protein ligase AIP2-like [Oryza brachyantha]